MVFTHLNMASLPIYPSISGLGPSITPYGIEKEELKR